MKLLHILILSAVCLLISEGSDLSIVNGHEAKPNSRPYMASIRNEKHHSCGGILIAKDWVLTAAHCTMHKGKTKVILGAHSISASTKESGRQILSVKKGIPHPNYRTHGNDIQLMKLSSKAKLGRKVKLLPLPETFEDVDAGTVCETAGWGRIEGGKSPKHLMEVNVSTISRKECQKRFKGEITENMICTSVGPKGEDICNGDSGGPLICDGVFRGILSFGHKQCGKPNGAAVYTRLIEEYIDWIQEIIA
ncbi:granzyme A-like [Dendropsophus ebraccatus]|uniref:granzyme A-like n=1 Tax=Dendropsophus ebraccatus TaxID=150705 RepID=UPI003831DE7E